MTTHHKPARRRFDDRAEGVISTAIAVMIIAFLGVAMWFAFSEVFNATTETTREQIEQIQP